MSGTATIAQGRETKTLQFKVKATGVTTDENGQRLGHIEAYGAAFNNVDEGNDRILPGAFTRTIQNSKARAKAREKKYALKMLWQHDTNEIIGGWYDLSEDGEGLSAKGDIALGTKRGQEFYELADLEMIDEFSIIYEVMPGGAKYDKSGVRDLTELRLFSIDPVTFPMNDSPHIIKIKSMEQKSVCGDTSLPIGPRDESWDGAAAKKQIFEYAKREDGTIDASKAKKCFLQVDGDTSLKGSWGYPFCNIVNGSPRINVGGVKACAGALAGGRGASTEGGDIAGMRRKVETLYKKINSKYPDATPLEATWDGKGNNRRMERKTFAEHYNEEMAQDLLEDWQDVYVCALTCAIFDAFTIGDQPEQDISEALDAFKETVLSKFVAQGVECGLSDYLEGHGYSYTPGLTTMQNGSDDGYYGYGRMSRSTRMDRKAGRAISAATGELIGEYVKSMKDMAKKAKSDMRSHVQDMHSAIDGMDDENDASDDGKKSLQLKNAVAQAMQAQSEKLHAHADKAMAIMQEHTKALTKAANGLADAVKPPVSDTDGEDPKGEDDTQVEKSLQDALLELKALKTA